MNKNICNHHLKILQVNKEKFAKAVAAEGISVGARYVKVMYEQTWIKEKNTYGNSHYPWSSYRNINYKNSCPIAEKALADHMTLYINECWADREIEDTVKALEKVEKAYCHSCENRNLKYPVRPLVCHPNSPFIKGCLR